MSLPFLKASLLCSCHRTFTRSFVPLAGSTFRHSCVCLLFSALVCPTCVLDLATVAWSRADALPSLSLVRYLADTLLPYLCGHLSLCGYFAAVAVLEPRSGTYFAAECARPPTLQMLCRQGCADPLGWMLGRRCCWFTLRILCRRRCWSPSLADTLLPSMCGPLTLRMLCRQGCFDPLTRMLCCRCRWFFNFSRWMLCHRGLVRSIGSFCVDVSSRRIG
jgi:hypothetical protein